MNYSNIPDFRSPLESPKRPPLGIMPFKMWNEQRKKDIEEAIIRYTLEQIKIPNEWIAELQTLTALFK